MKNKFQFRKSKEWWLQGGDSGEVSLRWNTFRSSIEKPNSTANASAETHPSPVVGCEFNDAPPKLRLMSGETGNSTSLGSGLSVSVEITFSSSLARE